MVCRQPVEGSTTRSPLGWTPEDLLASMPEVLLNIVSAVFGSPWV